jgi:hypothetical protein
MFSLPIKEPKIHPIIEPKAIVITKPITKTLLQINYSNSKFNFNSKNYFLLFSLYYYCFKSLHYFTE